MSLKFLSSYLISIFETSTKTKKGNSNWAACADPPNLGAIAGNRIACSGSCYVSYQYGSKLFDSIELYALNSY